MVEGKNGGDWGDFVESGGDSPFFYGEKLGKSRFFSIKNIMKIGTLGLFFQDSCITMWLIVA